MTGIDTLAKTWSGTHGDEPWGKLDLRLTDTCLRDGSHHKRHQFTAQEVHDMERAVQAYVPGYRLLQEPQIDEPSALTGGYTKVSIFVEVEGAGDFLPPYAGNLDIMTAAAAQVGENIARSIAKDA